MRKIGIVEDDQKLGRELRKQSDVPIIMITSKDTEMTELISMNSGADDFVAKPFHLQILLARIETILRRVYKEQEHNIVYDLGGFQFDQKQ